jgi:hypothetical protein
MFDGKTYFVSNTKGTFYVLPEKLSDSIKKKLQELKPHTWIDV